MRCARLAAVLGLVIALLIPGAAASAAELDANDIIVTVPETGGGAAGDRTITNAQLRWGLNGESGSAAFAGGCNFLSAGRAGNSGGMVWTAADPFYKAAEGSVRIEKPDSAGGWTRATWANKCLDSAGNPVSLSSAGSVSGNQVVIDGGTGRQTAAGLEIRWSGSFTVVFYGGMTYWSVTDPVLVLDAKGNGQLKGTASGFSASIDNPGEPGDALLPRSIVLAEIRGANVGAADRFEVTPEYLGVTAAARFEQRAFANNNAAYWGAFPESFLDFQRETGQLGFWLTTGGVRDAAKPATAVYVCFDVCAPITPPPSSSGGAAAPANSANFRPGSPAAARAAAATAESVPASSPLTFMPEREGLVPQAVAALLSPAALPLLGAALALLVAILAVLNMMGLLPWQQATLRV